MKLRRLGRTELCVSPIALGTVELGMDYGIPTPGEYGRPTLQEATRLVHTALDAGINLLDTARSYGASETRLGEILVGRRHKAIVATKVSVQVDGLTLRGDALRQTMMASLETSLRELRTDYVDLWQIHNVDHDLLEQAELVASIFDDARRAGKARWFGGSFYGADLPLAALRADLFDSLQVTFSVLDQRLADQVFASAQAQDVGILVRSVLLQGALTERADHLPQRLEPLRQRSRHFRRLVAEQAAGLTPAQAAIAFALAEPRISSVLVGMRSEAELAENLKALEQPLAPELVSAMRRLRLDDEELLNPGTWRQA